MKKFKSRTFVFTSVFVVVLLVIFCILIPKEKESFRLEKHNIIIGDSNTRWGMNDSILADYQNYSTGGETYLFALTKLKMLDKDNQIDTLMLSFNPHNIINNVWWNDSRQTPLLNRMPALYNYFSREDHLAAMKQTPKNYFSSILNVGKYRIDELILFKKENKMFKFGSFTPVKGKNPNDTIFSRRVPAKICTFELSYLKKIQKECTEKNIKLILIQPPKNNHSGRYPFYDFTEFYDIYHKDFGTIDFLDFSKMNLPEKYFWDIFHLNDQGADYFSQFLQKSKITNLLNSDYNLKEKKLN